MKKPGVNLDDMMILNVDVVVEIIITAAVLPEVAFGELLPVGIVSPPNEVRPTRLGRRRVWVRSADRNDSLGYV